MMHCLRERWRGVARCATNSLSIMVLLRLCHPSRASAEGRVDIKYEDYTEDHGRVSVQTVAGLFDVSLTSSLSARASVVLDSISGATPSGGAAFDINGIPSSTDQVPLTNVEDTRRAVSVELSQRWGRWTVSPQLAHSQESDYESWGLALNQTFDFNQKNTTLALGVSHDFDTVRDFPLPRPTRRLPRRWHRKDTTDALLGVTQLLGPSTVLTANFTFGYSTGFLSDPYKGVSFVGLFDPSADLRNEIRPSHKARQIGYLGLTQFITPVDASVEISYRIHHDTFGIWSHTAALSWFQKLGKYVVLEPSVRYYRQSASSFYYYIVPGSPRAIDMDPPPGYYSADFRASEFHAWTVGGKVIVNLSENFSFDFAYKRYEMSGEDYITPQSAYASANVFSAGATLRF